MTVSSTTARQTYIGDGSLATYSYNFRIFDAADLVLVKRNTSTGVETLLALTTDYTVTGAGGYNGGTFTLLAGVLPSGYDLAAFRELDLLQATDLRNQGAYLAEVQERALDRLVMITQQLQDQLNRSIRLPDSESGGDVCKLPTKEQRANQAQIYDANGDPTTGGMPASGIISAAMQTVTAAATQDTAASEFAFKSTAGSLSRNLRDRANDVINVKDFGAVGDMATDDTAAIQAAINYAQANKGRLYMPAGRYRCGTLTIAGITGLDIIGDRQPHVGPVGIGTEILYTGTDYAIKLNPAGGASYQYRTRIENIGIWFDQNCNGGIYGHNVQESTFINVGVNRQAGQTIAYGFDFDSAAIVNIDDCVVQGVGTGINLRWDAGGNASGSANITRNNLFFCTNSIAMGLVNFINIRDNYIEGFQNAILLDNSAPRQGVNVVNMLIDGNQFTQNTASLSETRAFKVASTTNTNPIRVVGKLSNNTAYMNSGTAVKPSYAFSFTLTGNVSTLFANVAIENNWIYGVTTAGIHSDTSTPIIQERGNLAWDAWLGNVLPAFAGFASRMGAEFVLAQYGGAVACPADTTEDILQTIILPANAMGKNGVLRVTTEWTCTNNANAKTVRVRLGGIGGTIIGQGSIASVAQASMTAKAYNRNASNSQLASAQIHTSAPSVQFWLTTGAIDTSALVTLVITAQKGTAGDTLTLESYMAEIIPQ